MLTTNPKISLGDRCGKLAEKDSSIICRSIVVKDNCFTTDPELLGHKCIEAGLLFNFSDIIAKQCYREGLRLAKQEKLVPAICDKYVKSLIEKRLGSEAAAEMIGLANVKSRYSAYGRKSNTKKVNEKETTESDDENLIVDSAELEELHRLNNEFIMIKAGEKRKRIRPDFIPKIGVEEEASSSTFQSKMIKIDETQLNSNTENSVRHI